MICNLSIYIYIVNQSSSISPWIRWEKNNWETRFPSDMGFQFLYMFTSANYGNHHPCVFLENGHLICIHPFHHQINQGYKSTTGWRLQPIGKILQIADLNPDHHPIARPWRKNVETTKQISIGYGILYVYVYVYVCMHVYIYIYTLKAYIYIYI